MGQKLKCDKKLDKLVPVEEYEHPGWSIEFPTPLADSAIEEYSRWMLVSGLPQAIQAAAMLLARPNVLMSWEEFARRWQESMSIYGIAYAWLIRDGFSQVTEVFLISSGHMLRTHHRDEKTQEEITTYSAWLATPLSATEEPIKIKASDLVYSS